jgi:hypothetical protein
MIREENQHMELGRKPGESFVVFAAAKEGRWCLAAAE